MRVLPLGFLALWCAAAQGQDPVITEFLAVNDGGLVDGNGSASDWVEIHNPSGSEIDLTGWHLTDTEQDLIRWTFPAGSTIAAGSYEIVFASGDPTPPPGEWHADFSLDGDGEYLALVRPDGLTVVSEFAPAFPPQREDVSFGSGAGGELLFFTTPTPGTPNGAGVLGFVGDTQFSHNRGFYDTPFEVAITATEPGSTIRYTLDGSEPSLANGSTYTAPLPVATTTVLRARAYKTGFLETNVDTQTYLFPADVVGQPLSVPGWPRNNYSLGGGENGQHDYQMDPEVVDDPAYSGMVVDAMKAIPTMSLVVDRDDMFGSGGFYDSSDNEETASVEVIYPDAPSGGEQVDCGVEGHSHIRMKRSLRLNFRSEFGASTFATDLFKAMPWNPKGERRQDVLILRAGNNRAWSRAWSEEKCTFAEDQLSRQTQLAASGYGMRGAFVHLYINGLYWGLYDVVERADENFTARYFGGESEDWYARNHGGSLSGSSSRYNYLVGALKNKDMADAANYAELQEYLDVAAFIDYLLLHWLTATSDWPSNNWYAGHRNPSSPLGATPLRYFAWDGEWSWDLPHPGNPSPRNLFPYDPWVHPQFEENDGKNSSRPITNLFNSAKDNDDFLRLLADRAYKHLFNGGAMSDAAMQARYTAITDTIADAVVAESARWGDTLEPGGEPTYTRDVHWRNAVDVHLGLMEGRAEKMIAALRDENYYPSVDPPTFNQRGGEVAAGFGLVLGNANGSGSIRYTLDGSDPADGGALTYTAPIPIGGSVQVRTRILSGGEWSAIDEAVFIVPGPPELVISEIMYHPSPPTVAEIDAGFTDQDQFEYLEIHNRGNTPVELEGVRFTDGVSYTFPPYLLPPDERILVVSDAGAFAHRYGLGDPVVGSFAPMRLSNGGERLRLETALGELIAEVEYDDRDPWPEPADGDGFSLVYLDGEPALASSWRASALPGGSPAFPDEITYGDWAAVYLGALPAALRLASADPDGDGIVNGLEYAFDLVPTASDSTRLPRPEFTAPDTVALDYPVRLWKTDLSVTPQASPSLEPASWSSAGVTVETLSAEKQTENRRASISSSGEERNFMRFRVTLQ